MIVSVVGSEKSVVTERLEVRHPLEADRQRFVELFCNEAFMVFSDGVMSEAEAHARFDRMLVRCTEVPFAKQSIDERSSGLVIGYTGVDWIDFADRRWLEWGYRAVLRCEIGCRVGMVLAGAAGQIMSASSSNAAVRRR